MATSEKIILPPKYYLEYFKYLISFIRKASGHCLSDADESFIQLLGSLSEDAQCLLVRMLNRKGEYFRLDKLPYSEIGNIPAAADELLNAGLISFDPPADPLLFRLFTKSELHRLFPEHSFDQKYKEDVLVELSESLNKTVLNTLTSRYTILVVLCQEQIEYFKLLFFGHYHAMMTEFVIRDVGHVKLENTANYEFTTWFDSRDEAMAVFQLSRWNSTIKIAMEATLPSEIMEMIALVNWNEYLRFPKARKAGDRLMLRLGEYFEKTGYREQALEYYSLARKHPARERRVRILESLQLNGEAIGLAKAALEYPVNASERIFMQDFLARESKRNYRSTTARIKEAPEITVNRLPGYRVEELAIAHFAEAGFQGMHSENYIWRALFGLLFWEELFDSSFATFHHPLQRMPSDLYNTSFYETRRSLLQTKVSGFQSRKSLTRHIFKTYHEKNGVSNPLVGWHEMLPSRLEACLCHLPLAGLKKVMLEIAKNVKDNSAGFPDLFIWNDTEYHFYEIKSPNDHLSSQQLFWLEFFKEHKIRAEILRVNYL